MSSHGPQFDEFHASPTHAHGGAEFDEFARRPAADAGAKGSGESSNLHDHQTTSALHGAQWDEFGWRDMPVGHGHSFDSNFRQPAALDGSEDHGTWYDVFRGGTQVRAIAEGNDVEGVVTNQRDDHVVVRIRDGRDLELGLQQLRAFRHVEATGAPSRTGIKTAHVETGDGVAPASTAHAPSAHDAKARGGGRTAITLPDTGSKTANKADVDELDVTKALTIGPGHSFCGKKGCVEVAHKMVAGTAYQPKEGAPAGSTCHNCGTKIGKTADGLDVAKTLDELRGLVATYEA